MRFLGIVALNFCKESISYSKLKAKERRKRMQDIEEKMKVCEEKVAKFPTQANLDNLESAKLK